MIEFRKAGHHGVMVLLTLVLLAAMLLPLNLARPQAVNAGIMKWDTVKTPGTYVNRYDIVPGSEIIQLVVQDGGNMMLGVVKRSLGMTLSISYDTGISWGGSSELGRAMVDKWGVVVNVWDAAIAPDDSNFWAIVTSSSINEPVDVWVTEDGGASWGSTDLWGKLQANETIRTIDISADWGGKRDIAVGTVNTSTSGGGRWFVRSSKDYGDWREQENPIASQNYYALKFSPTYNADSSVAMVYADTDSTYYNVAFRDVHTSDTPSYAFGAPGIEVRNPATGAGASPGIAQLNNVSLKLPSDFSGQSSSLRRAYVSLDAYGHKSATSQDGIYRIDDTTTYLLMDTTNISSKSIYSIAYFGTYASGKLLAGERMGFPCTATVPTWFTDSPTTCPIPCWYPALKPTTGAATTLLCPVGAQNGMGTAIVGWNADGSLGLVSTGSLAAYPATVPWYHDFTHLTIDNDESAFAISRNNGETWNQISLIDTTIDWFNDVAVSPDCSTIYLASVNRNAGDPCYTFDSVWRSSINPNVTSPMPAIPPLGYYWERVFTHTTSSSCTVVQSDLPILRVVQSCTDKADGEIVGWAAQLAGTTGFNSGNGVMAWSPDYGDYWAMITPRYPVQDFTFESSTAILTLSPSGLVQRLPYSGTSWSTNLPSYDTTLLYGHTIASTPDGKVLVGSAIGATYPAAYSANKGVDFSLVLDAIPEQGNEHVIFDVDFKNNSFIYMGDDDKGLKSLDNLGTVNRNTVPNFGRWLDKDMMAPNNGAYGIDWPAGDPPPHPVGIFGLAQAWTGSPQPALYAAHPWTLNSLSDNNSAVCRTLEPWNGIPKPGVGWDCLDIFTPFHTSYTEFTLEPSSLKYCGCCSLTTNTTLYVIDDESGNFWSWDSLSTNYQGLNRTGRFDGAYDNPPGPGYTPNLNLGMLWTYTDCLAKKGPILKGPADKYLVGADPVTGRNQQVDLSWEQLCLSTWYELQVAKDAAFTLRINPAVNNSKAISAVTGSILLEMDVTNMTSPAAWIAPGALPEAGAIYYWRIRSHKSATEQIAWSPWSAARTFTVKAGFIVNTPYYGVQLLAPSNGCVGCKVKPASFSWSPWKEATKYQFDLAKDPEFKTLVVTATTTTSGYEYNGKLDYSTNYFWRVKAIEVNGLNIPSDWSATFSMQTEPAPSPAAAPPAEAATPLWVWVTIALGAILLIVILILTFKTRRV